MANPQREAGYTAIANEIMEALAGIRIPGEARQCLDLILRKTYGFNKKTDQISLSQFALITKLGKGHIIQGLHLLAKINIIITEKGNEKGNLYRFNKDYSAWKPLPKKVTLPKKVMGVTEKGNEALPKKGHTKVDYTKTTLTKTNSEQSSQEIKQVMDIFYTINPTLNWGNKTTRKAAEDLINKFGLNKTLQLAQSAVAVFGQPFAPVITTPYQLKEKLSALAAFYAKKPESRVSYPQDYAK